MKPTATMLAVRPSPRDEETAAHERAEAERTLTLARARLGGRLEAACARLAPGALLDRVGDVARALEVMKEPPVLGVRANGNDNRPSKAAWDSARKVALDR